jgi:glutathione-independent formaldehyde dehydrogenase
VGSHLALSEAGWLVACGGVWWCVLTCGGVWRRVQVMKYHRPLMNAIMYDKINIAKAVNAQVPSPSPDLT